MSDRKSIVINSASLLGGGVGGGKKSTRRAKGSGTGRRLRPSSIVQPSTLKKTLLERIKQHQRLREQGRDIDADRDRDRDDDSSSERKDTTSIPASDTSSAFSQSMDFLRKLALKKRQNVTQRRPSLSSSHVPSLAAETAKTPEAKMLNQVADTLHNGEIITNTGLLGLPVINTDVSSIMRPPPLMAAQAAQATATAMATIPMMTGMSMPGISDLPFGMTHAPSAPSPSPIPNITELANIYNSTVASTSDNSNTNTNTGGDAATGVKSADDLPIHVPEDPESFLPSIFIKDAPPHGCLKNGSKPTFREWANKMLHKPVEAIKNMFGGGDGDGGGDGGGDGSGAAASSSAAGMDGGGGTSAGKTLSKHHEHPENIAGMRVKIRKTQKKKYRIGKHDDVVGVLLKNKEAQRHIQKQHLALKQKTIGEIRKHLYEHHLLKIGSNAPPDVLRRMYEDSILTGEVKNTNKGVLLHNFLSGES
jgi:hypothetical protein